MYEPLPYDDDLAPEANEFRRQHVLTSGEVAQLLDVTQQAVHQWTKAGTIPEICEERPAHDLHRYSLRDVVEKAVITGRKVHIYRLPVSYFSHYDIAPLTEHDDAILYSAPGAEHVGAWVSEAETARALDMNRQTLRNHRERGLLNPEVKVRPHPSPTNTGVQYSRDSITKVIADELPLYRPTTTDPKES